MACNAATAMAIDHLRAAYPIPFVGLEPAVKPAALSSRSGVIGILATAATLRGKLFRETSRRYEDRVRIIARVGEGFVELVEQNRERTEEAYSSGGASAYADDRGRADLDRARLHALSPF